MDETAALHFAEHLADDLSGHGYQALLAQLGESIHQTDVVSGDGSIYNVETVIHWDDPDARTIRVTVLVDQGGLRAFRPLSSSVIVAPHAPA